MAADNGAAFSGSLWTVVVVSGIFVALRGGAKVSRKRNLRSDDYIMFVAWLLLFIASTLMQRAVALGFGRNKAELSHAHQWDISTFAVIYSATLTIVVSLARISFAISLLRCTTGWSKVVVWTMIVGLVCITMVPLVVTRFTICTPFQKVYGVEAEGHCGNTWIPLYIGWASGAWSAFSDFVLLVVAWSIVWVMKKERREKIGIAIALSFGIISGALTVFRYVYVALIYAQDFYQYGYLGFLWVAAEGGTSMVAASIPALRAFLKSRTASPVVEQGKWPMDHVTYENTYETLVKSGTESSVRPWSDSTSPCVKDLESQVHAQSRDTGRSTPSREPLSPRPLRQDGAESWAWASAGQPNEKRDTTSLAV